MFCVHLSPEFVGYDENNMDLSSFFCSFQGSRPFTLEDTAIKVFCVNLSSEFVGYDEDNMFWPIFAVFHGFFIIFLVFLRL